MITWDQELFKCSLIVGALFIVFSHPFMYRLMHKYFSSIAAFVDINQAPTEAGVIIHAILFGLVIYLGKTYYEKNQNDSNSHQNNNQNNLPKNDIPGRCKVYCEKISQEISYWRDRKLFS